MDHRLATATWTQGGMYCITHHASCISLPWPLVTLCLSMHVLRVALLWDGNHRYDSSSTTKPQKPACFTAPVPIRLFPYDTRKWKSWLRGPTRCHGGRLPHPSYRARLSLILRRSKPFRPAGTVIWYLDPMPTYSPIPMASPRDLRIQSRISTPLSNLAHFEGLI
jgi:hypothetical protein